MIDLIKRKHNTEDIVKRRKKIAKHIMKDSQDIKSGTISSISTLDLELLFDLYDSFFLGDWFNRNYKGKLNFSLSRRMTRSAGSTLCSKNIAESAPQELVLEIRIGVDFLFNYGLIERVKTVCGVDTNNSLQALQLVFEHELCHVIEYICFQKSNCKGNRFKTIASNLFGHTASHHNLPTYKQIAKQKFVLNIGDSVSFTFKEERMNGILNNINKRATVLVPDKTGPYKDKLGNRYTKYYVPLELLERIK
ncbi:MAG: hypothetical protein PHV50_01115 [Syntrophaceticus sp.]|nr:hypothetical protein [Syntrophaceticus sp.]MDD3314346.1 hypothetical protein [Syntrophaceticus sp.]MDD4359151.1 hypothetical protein [Syntrophaceticus sp.]